MILRKPSPDSGIFFAFWPRRTPQGLAVGWLHYEWDGGWGWGSSGFWRYTNWVPEERYKNGERRNFEPKCVREGRERQNETWTDEQARLQKNPPNFYSTPPDKSKCRNLRSVDPTGCWHPHCTCMDAR